jgi:hypothetical protein
MDYETWKSLLIPYWKAKLVSLVGLVGNAVLAGYMFITNDALSGLNTKHVLVGNIIMFALAIWALGGKKVEETSNAP